MGEQTVVRTARGAVRGRTEGGVTAFLGIPFAAPPLGALRFQAPQPAAPWDGVREADAFGPPPPQAPLGPQPPAPEPVRHDPGDWLTLNVWTPDPGAAGLPVLVWVYGGAYRMGSSAEPGYRGSVLAGHGAVVVTANHRVGVEGYAQLDGAPANRGLLDVVAVLRWVREEIAAFGGDPANVTVFGESAGAGAVAALMVMPAAEGLFDRVIAQSVPATCFTPALARDVSAEIVAPLGLAPSAAALADVDPQRLVDALGELDRRMPAIERWGLVAHTPTPFSPVVDGEVLPTDPWTGLAAGAARDVPLVVGHTRDEWRLFLVMGGQSVTDEMAAGAMRVFGPEPDPEERMRAAFPGASAEELFVLACSDRMFRMPSVHLAEAHTAGGGRSHLYELTWPTPALGGVFGACHALDVPLVFGVSDEGLPLQLVGSPPPDDAREVSAQMQAAWTGFARDGDPGWTPYDARQLTRVFDVGERGGVRPYPEEASWKLWADRPPEVVDLR
ncbi:MAG TPA: carboxylesterase family protein [Pseudonocardia sp.]|mgnify:CR=1 FL=1|jgi:para-nitrobenzyl esterase|uniref:carboxylesterase/lipase family protein n=1 Tax=Pseudonocardia sp. TaxID=60912 RepID=UPI002B4B532A|nr:carboxylesterase family protein [Pseudonocardia sp.]HLU53999.1 carboxylesterase family protein [Pseudonocardia sp.]